jgi:glutamine amidotransferase
VTIAILDYGMGNLTSARMALEHVGATVEVTSDHERVRAADAVVLPGVGAFPKAMEAIRRLRLDELMRERRDAGVPVLGICLGMQLLGCASEEGVLPGLGLIDAESRRFQSEEARPIKVPHMGWSELAIRRTSPLFERFEDRARFYFVHSYHLVCRDQTDVLATARYGVEFTAMIHRENVWGAQFHPEKSHRFGMTLLGNFARL